jgi:outer membrane protein assembly factor BamA
VISNFVKISAAITLFSSLAFSDDRKDTVLIVKDIVILGNEKTQEHVILREMSLKVGERITSTALEYDKNRIYSLQLFNKVDLDYTVEGEKATLFVRVSERWYIFPVPILGFKYRDPKNFYYGLGFVHDNFRGRNEKLVGSFALGFDRWASVSYQNPKITDDDDIFFRGYLSLSKVRNQNVSQGIYDQTVHTGELSLGKRMGLHHTLLGTAGYRRWKVSDPQPGRTVSITGVDSYVTIGVRYTFDTRDVREYATEGVEASLWMTKYGVGEGEIDLFRSGYDFRGFIPLGFAEAALGARAFGGFTAGGIVPSYLHSYFGYDERIRGHFSTVLEGENILGHSVELRVPILLPRYGTITSIPLPAQFSVWRFGMYAGFFADAGKIWYRGEGVGGRPWYSGYGMGLHFLLPYSIVLRTEYALNHQGAGQFVLDFGASF